MLNYQSSSGGRSGGMGRVRVVFLKGNTFSMKHGSQHAIVFARSTFKQRTQSIYYIKKIIFSTKTYEFFHFQCKSSIPRELLAVDKGGDVFCFQ